MIERKVVHGDETFERFRRRLADVVTLRINEGRVVTAEQKRWWSFGEGCGCPLGCIFDDAEVNSSVNHARLAPTTYEAASAFGIKQDDSGKFICGFAEVRGVSGGPYFELGQLYAERFP